MNHEKEIIRQLKKGIKRMDVILGSQKNSETRKKRGGYEQRIAKNEMIQKKYLADYNHRKV